MDEQPKYSGLFRVGYDSVRELEPELWEARLRLAFQDGTPFLTSGWPGFGDRLIAKLPALRTHRCENGTARGFAMELQDTEIAHAFEHTVLELLAQKHPEKARTYFTGKTGFDFAKDGQGVFRVVIFGFFSEEEARVIADEAFGIIMQTLGKV